MQLLKENLVKVFLLALLCVAATQMRQVTGQDRSDCTTSCGNVTIEYPFGTLPGCYLDESFLITCNSTVHEPFLNKSNIRVLSISYKGELRVMINRSFVCYDSQGNITDGTYYDVGLLNFTLSNTKNKFTSVGCDTYAYLSDLEASRYSTGCISVCKSIKVVDLADGPCSGIGCCQNPVPREAKSFRLRPYSFNKHSSVNDFNPCSYAFLVEDGYFNFSASQDLKNLRDITEFPVVIDWSIGDKTCEQTGNTSICGENSECVNSPRKQGYICQCLPGFTGNPYLRNGCQDVNECAQHSHNCTKLESCHNTNGGFQCRKRLEWTIIILGTTIGFLVFLLGLCCLNQELRNRKHIKLREKFFEQNGGIMLRQRLSARESSTANDDIKIFTEEEIKKATNGYEESRIIGEGGQGTVYKGSLQDNREVAIKKAHIGDNSQVEQFINEVIVLSQINHRNVVKLLGCCLETEVPLLIYEFMSNGTLFDHLHTSKFKSFLSWEDRLRIAVETAGTLGYLHSSASVPIIHRDFKSANILLDDKLSAKVSDFGASRLIPVDKKQLETLVQGTLGYLDPEYFHTSVLNEKSDVYSFGVVLMELISGQKALSFDRPQNKKHLVAYFAYALNENRLQEVVDSRVVNAKNHKQLQEAASLAVRCTRVKGEERPRMKEVASELEGLRVIANPQQNRDQCPEEVEWLLGDQILSARGDCSDKSDYVSRYDSIANVVGLDIEAGR